MLWKVNGKEEFPGHVLEEYYFAEGSRLSYIEFSTASSLS